MEGGARPEARTPFGIARHVGMRVDQPRDEGASTRVKGIWRALPRRPVDRSDAIAVESHGGALEWDTAETVDQTDVPQRRHRRFDDGASAPGALWRTPARLVPAPAPSPRTSGPRRRRARPLLSSSRRTGPIRTR